MADVLSLLARELERFVEPLTRAAPSAAGRRELLGVLGWNLDELTGYPVDELAEVAATIGQSAAQLAQLAQTPPDDLEAVGDLVTKIAALVEAIRRIQELASDPSVTLPADVTTALGSMGQTLVEFLGVEYLNRYRPLAHDVARLLTLVRASADYGAALTPSIGGANGEPEYRRPAAPPRFRVDRLGNLLADPAATLRAEYLGPEGLTTAGGARFTAGRIFDRLAPLLVAAGARVSNGTDTAGWQQRDSSRTLEFRYGLRPADDELAIGALLQLLSDEEGGARLVVTPTGWDQYRIEGSSWALVFDVSGQIAEFALTRTGVTLSAGAPAVRVGVVLKRFPATSAEAVMLGGSAGTRLEIGTVTITGNVDLDGDQAPDVGVLVEFGHAAVAVAAGDGDGFLAKILPPGGFRVDFDLAFGWSTRRGLYLRGAAQLDAQIPVHTTFLGVLTLETVDLSVGARGDPAPGVTAVAAATATLHLGPVTASVERIGLELRMTFPEGGGNVGPANLALAFHPPIGAALAISAAVVSGGGYLRADHPNGRYGGVLQLQIAEVVNATAIASLVVSPSPAQPDAPRNYSLLLILVAEFPPIQLGFGFTLNGLGGILGANRTINLDALRAGVRTRALDSILFPQDAAANAIRILRDVEAVFPPAPGQFVIGLMARFGWGSPRLITIDVGIIIELPSPLRIVLLGRLSLALPEQEAAVVELHLDVVGILDLTNKNLSIDATLYDSRVAAFTISGDMAARLNYGTEPGLALSAGGFNPRFTPPPDFPQLRRLAISLGDGDNPRIRLDAYLANTANSIQIGARLEVYVEADLGVLGVFSATAYLGFDALITLVPFSFVVDLAGGVEIRRNGAVLFGAELRLSLSGPQPVRAWGYAQFDFFGRHRIPFDHTFGPDPLELLLAVADPVAALLAALADPRNWETQLPAAAPPTASLRELPPPPDGAVLAHPLGRIGVRQRTVPLDVPIDRFAGAPAPTTARTLHVSVSLGGTAAAATPVRDAFPTGESLDLTDDEKLSREQFSQWPCGLSGIGLAGMPVTAGTAVTGVDGYETRLVDPIRRTRRGGGGYASADALLAGFLDRGAAGTGPLHRSGVAAHVGPALGVAARSARCRVLDQADLTVVDVDGTGRTEYESESEALAARDRRADAADLVVAGAHEGAAP